MYFQISTMEVLWHLTSKNINDFWLSTMNGYDAIFKRGKANKNNIVVKLKNRHVFLKTFMLY